MAGDDKTPLRLEDLWLLVVFIGFGPAMVLVNNPEGPPPWTPLLFVLIVVGVSLLLRAALSRLGLDGRGLTYALAIGGFAALNLGLLLESVSRSLVLLQVALIGVLAYRLRDVRAFRFLVTWACLALTVGPVVLVVQDRFSGSEPAAIGESEDLPAFDVKPDVVVLVADGYGSEDVLSEFYGFDNSHLRGELATLQMPMNPAMKSNYGRTKFSVASFLDLGYIPDGTPITSAVESGLVATMGGKNRMTETLMANGYRTVYFESGWLGARCGDEIDVCVGGPWPDETYYDIAHRSVFRDLPGFEHGISFSRGAQHAMAALEENLEGYLQDDQPDFVFVHLLAPHPPFFLTESCEMEPSIPLAGFAVSFPNSTDAAAALRSDAYIDQIECVNDLLIRTAEAISDSGAIGLFLGDHGPDRLGQLFDPADGWTDEQRSERLGILFAAHHPGCDYSSVTSLVNAGRHLLACLSGTELEPLPDRFFDIDKTVRIPVMVEIAPPSEGLQ